jgi:glycosyltransferase involved in cell wall biosynthesis
MKIAIFHNFMDNIGGAEIVSLHFARHFKADLYTTNVDIEKIKKMGFEDVVPQIKSIGKIPRKSPFKQQLTFWKFRNLNLGKQYDFYIISGDWAMSGAVNHHPNLWYVHSPLNELWQFKDFIKKNILSWWQKPIFEIWAFLNQKLSLKYSNNVDNWVCNSENTKKRIKKFYKRDAEVIYPPIITEDYFNDKNDNYWLSVNRLFRNKRVELQLEAFSRLPNKKLTIVGSYEHGAEQFEEYKKYLDNIKPPNVEIKHWGDKDELLKLYSECTGFLTTSLDEDFGMTPIEALASGKPVIAPNEGGYKETITDKINGILINEINSTKIENAIIEIESNLNQNNSKYIEINKNKAQTFDIDFCISKISDLIKTNL